MSIRNDREYGDDGTAHEQRPPVYGGAYGLVLPAAAALLALAACRPDADVAAGQDPSGAPTG